LPREARPSSPNATSIARPSKQPESTNAVTTT